MMLSLPSPYVIRKENNLDTYLAGLAAHAAPIIAIILAAFLQSITGFGLIIVGAPLLLLFYDPKLVVPCMLLIAVCGNCVQGLMYIKQAELRLIGWLVLGVVLGQPLGLWTFNFFSSDSLKIFISAAVMIALALNQMGRWHVRECHRNTVITGFFSGFTSITTGMGGPPFLIYLANIKIPVDRIRATCFCYFFLCNSTSLLAFHFSGMSLAPAFGEFIYLLPGLVIGIIIGHLCYSYIPKKIISRLIFLLLYATSLYTIATTLWTKYGM